MTLDEVRRDWTRLGAEDPLWAVHMQPGKRGGRWDVEEFLRLGREDVAAARAWLAELDLPTTWDRVLDFGCGAGRLSQALAGHAGQVVGVDVSEPMLETARHLDRSDGRCEFLLNAEPHLGLFEDDRFDLVYSELVLQHLPLDAIEGYVAEFLRVLRPGGVAVLQCTTNPLWTAKGIVWRFVPRPVIRLAQRRILRYPAPMRMTAYPPHRMAALVAANGGTVVATITEDRPETHWRYSRYAVRANG